MTPRHTHPDDDQTYACPECDRAGQVYEREHQNREYDHRYTCHDCGATFDAPVERDAHSTAEAYDQDGLPCGLSPAAKQTIRSAREVSE